MGSTASVGTGPDGDHTDPSGKKCTCIYQSPLILTELFQHNLINVSYLTACYLYQVMIVLFK